MSSIAGQTAGCRAAAAALDRLAAADPNLSVYVGVSIQLAGSRLGDIATAAKALGARFHAEDRGGEGVTAYTAVEAEVEVDGTPVSLYTHLYDPADRDEARRLYGDGDTARGAAAA